jgi:tetratricopeptide (TPR) repeat protein
MRSGVAGVEGPAGLDQEDPGDDLRLPVLGEEIELLVEVDRFAHFRSLAIARTVRAGETRIPGPVTTLEQAAAHWREWFDRGEFEEGAARVHEALAAPGAEAPSIERARVLYGAHLFAFRLGQPSAAYARQALELARELGDVRGECDGLTGLARAALREGDYAKVAAYAGEGVRKARESGDRGAEGSPLHLQAAGVRLTGDYDGARELYLESVALGDDLGDERRKQTEFHNLGWVELHRGDVESAARMFGERDARSGLDAMGDAWTDLNQSALAVARGERAEAARLFESGSRKLDELGAALDPDDQSEFDWLKAQLA